MNKKFITVVLLSYFAFFPCVVFAQTATPSASSKIVAVDTVLPTSTADKLASKKVQADKEIDRRIAALNTVLGKISAMKKLPDANKTTLSSEVQTEITNLNALKAKIDADTDAAMLKTDKQSIVTSYRVFALFIPQINILASADILSQVADNLTNIANKLQTRIGELQQGGTDVTALQNALTDLQAKTADIKTQYENINSTVLPLTPDGYPANKSVLQSAKKMLQAARQDLKTARQDITTIMRGLPNNTSASTAATNSAVPAAVASPSATSH